MCQQWLWKIGQRSGIREGWKGLLAPCILRERPLPKNMNGTWFLDGSPVHLKAENTISLAWAVTTNVCARLTWWPTNPWRHSSMLSELHTTSGVSANVACLRNETTQRKGSTHSMSQMPESWSTFSNYNGHIPLPRHPKSFSTHRYIMNLQTS